MTWLTVCVTDEYIPFVGAKSIPFFIEFLTLVTRRLQLVEATTKLLTARSTQVNSCFVRWVRVAQSTVPCEVFCKSV